MQEPTAVLRPEASASELRVISSRQSAWQQIRDVWKYRELLAGLVRKELKVKYKDSVLGFVWSLLNPALTLTLFYIVFQIIFANGIPRYAVLLACGLLVWNFYSSSVAGATGAVVANSSIVKKVAFPREILALATVGASLVHFFLQCFVLLAALVLFHSTPAWGYMPLIPVALFAVVLVASAVGIFLSAFNVRMRDTQHLIEIALQLWMWSTPIVYPYMQVAHRLHDHSFLGMQHIEWIYRLNPITPVVMTFQRVFYNIRSAPSTTGDHHTIFILPQHGSVWWYGGQLLGVCAFGAVALWLALQYFGKVQADFAEEL